MEAPPEPRATPCLPVQPPDRGRGYPGRGHGRGARHNRTHGGGSHRRYAPHTGGCAPTGHHAASLELALRVGKADDGVRRKCLPRVQIAAMPPARCIMVKSCVAVWSCLLLVSCDSRCAPPLAAPGCGGTSFALSWCRSLSGRKPAMVPTRVLGETQRAYTKRKTAWFDQGPDATPRACWMGLSVTGICGHWSRTSRTALRGSGRSQSERSSEDARLLAAVKEGNEEAVQEILVAGGSPAAADDWGTTCLQAAVKGGHIEVVRALLSAGADANVASTSDDETTPLHCAVHKGPDSCKIQTFSCEILTPG